MATVDIIIPAYNAARHLSSAIDSVIAQSYDDWRIILVNDGSSDATAQIAERFQQQLGPRMLVITQANAGVSAARNTAIRAATGDFLAMLDADDIWLPCRLAESLKSFELRPAAGLSYGLVTRISESGELLATFAGNPQNAEGRIAPYIYMRSIELPCVTVTLRRSCLAETGLFDETMRATEDRDLWLRIAQRYEVAYVPKVIALYRTYANSASADIDGMLSGQLRFIRKNYGISGCGPIARQIATARAYKQRAEGMKDRSRPWAALLDSLRACIIWPFSWGNFRTAGSLLFNCARPNSRHSR